MQDCNNDPQNVLLLAHTHHRRTGGTTFAVNMPFRHMVIMKIRSDVPQAEIDEIYAALQGLTSKIPGLVSFSGGPYSSPEGLNKGFTHGFTMDFATESQRDAYFPHPDHEIVKNMIIARVDDVIAFDYAF